jgi:hypothetical protein
MPGQPAHEEDSAALLGAPRQNCIRIHLWYRRERRARRLLFASAMPSLTTINLRGPLSELTPASKVMIRSTEILHPLYRMVRAPRTAAKTGATARCRSLSDQALDWILDGARAAGLVLDPQDSSRIFELKPDYTEYLDDSPNDGLFYRLENVLAAADREPGPATLNDVSISAQHRWLEDPQESQRQGAISTTHVESRKARARYA